MKSGKLLLAVATLLLLGFVTSAWAQSPAPDDQLGYVPGQSYHGSDIDHTSLQTGNLVVDIPILSYSQRGGVLKVDFHILQKLADPLFLKTLSAPKSLQVKHLAADLLRWADPGDRRNSSVERILQVGCDKSSKTLILG